ncbi:MAG: extracellular solute-binding protein [Erysipelotrichaceae bacterium]|nr:extracellular solute-binding protein [Erysipelotrichaceae bacterium]
MKKFIAALLALTMLFSFAGCGNNNGGGEDGPTGEVMIYSSMAQSVLEALEARFEELYPGVDMNFVQAGSGKISTKLTTELQAGTVECDIVWLADASEFVEYKNAGNLVAYESKYASTVDQMFRDPDNMYIGARAVLIGFAYAPDQVSETLSSWKDLLKPEYKDKIVMTDAGASGSMKTWLYVLVNQEKYGWDFIQAMYDNGLKLESGTTATHNKVADGTYAIGVGVEFVAKNLIADGANLAWAEIVEDAIAYYSPIAIPKGCPNLENAKLLYDFIMNPEEGQRILVEQNVTPVQPATPVPDTMHPASWIVEHAIAFDVDDMAAKSTEMLAKYDSIFKK